MSKSTYLVIDTETTGTDFSKHGLIQIAALALNKKFFIKDQFVIDVNPPEGTEITEFSLELTGFSLDRIKKGKSYRQAAEELNQFVSKNFKDKPIMIAQFYPFDYAFTQILLTATGMDKDIFDRNFIDTKSLANVFNAKARLEGREPVFGITSLSKKRGLKNSLGIEKNKFLAHDALGDCLATREVLVKLMELFSINSL